MATKTSGRGHKQTKETRAKISKANTGRKLSEETKAKISKAMMGNTNGRGNRKS